MENMKELYNHNGSYKVLEDSVGKLYVNSHYGTQEVTLFELIKEYHTKGYSVDMPGYGEFLQKLQKEKPSVVEELLETKGLDYLGLVNWLRERSKIELEELGSFSMGLSMALYAVQDYFDETDEHYDCDDYDEEEEEDYES